MLTQLKLLYLSHFLYLNNEIANASENPTHHKLQKDRNWPWFPNDCQVSKKTLIKKASFSCLVNGCRSFHKENEAVRDRHLYSLKN